MKHVIQYFKLTFAFIAALSVLLTSCSDFLEIAPPKTEIIRSTVFTNDGSASSAVTGVYTLMMSNVSFTRAGIEELTGIASDELVNYSLRADQVQFYQNTISSKNTDVLQVFWTEAYKYISNANGILEGLDESTDVTPEVSKRLEGEALFIRAFSHYYLSALFGDIPYLTSTDYKVNSKAPRVDIGKVREQIELDLLTAGELMADDFSMSQGERIRPNKYAAYALLSRLYLDMGEWGKAEAMATAVIDQPKLFSLAPIADVFLANSTESIWQLRPVVPNTNTPQAQLFILTGAPNSSSRRVSLKNELVSSFELTDTRKNIWINQYNGTTTWYYVYKYKVNTGAALKEYNTVFRLAEQYLNRAEARTHLSNFSGAAEDINAIRDRAGLDNTTASDEPSLLDAILNERRHEFFGEWGHRWLDLKRMEKADAVLQPIKPNWQSTDALFPIPESERLLNTNLSQNAGY